ncbi:MobA/MobL family protein [Terribacillus saccharophilus]|uniref:MobA/MobL family protein n=1 Tax=Terribacillus saccharophilus TaxID=361277 RepID=UPI002989DBFF|nr:MobA/MobL family protein [Terribacillus saccharophilus]MCM3227570.1 MobA/MobL family protein [Terribacillus saccharophilus]
MSTYHFKAKFINKRDQSAIAKAAYVSGKAIYSERDEETKNYKPRLIEPESFILAPENAPDWVYNREKLWNEVEKVERPYNASLLREIVVAIPKELTNEQQVELVKEFVDENFVSDGMVADVNIHRDKEENPHAHILLTIRPFNEKGEWWKTKSKKVTITDNEGNPVLNDKGKPKTRNVDLTGWNSKDKLIMWRKNFAEKVNEYYKENGYDITVSHLSNEERGLDKLPQTRLTRSEYYIEKKAKKEAELNNREYKAVTFNGQYNEQIQKYNQEIELINNEIMELNELRSNNIAEIPNVIEMNELQERAIDSVKKRQKVDSIDYTIAAKNIKSLSYWKMNIDKQIRVLDREEKILRSVKEMYEGGRTNYTKYGFTEDKFIHQFNYRISKLNENYGKMTEQLKNYKEDHELANVALKFKVNELDHAFLNKYPKLHEIAQFQHTEIMELKHKAVTNISNDFTEYDIINYVNNYDGFLNTDELNFRERIRNEVEDYKQESRLFFTLNKKLEQLEGEYKELVSSDEPNKLYKKTVEYLAAKSELENLNTKYENTKAEIRNSLVELYGKHHEDTFKSMPDKYKVKLLQSFIDNKEINELDKDLERVSNRAPNRKDEEFEQDFDSNQWNPNTTSNNSGDLLSELIQNAKRDESGYDDLESKRKRAKIKNSKLTKEEINGLRQR